MTVQKFLTDDAKSNPIPLSIAVLVAINDKDQAIIEKALTIARVTHTLHPIYITANTDSRFKYVQQMQKWPENTKNTVVALLVAIPKSSAQFVQRKQNILEFPFKRILRKNTLTPLKMHLLWISTHLLLQDTLNFLFPFIPYAIFKNLYYTYIQA